MENELKNVTRISEEVNLLLSSSVAETTLDIVEEDPAFTFVKDGKLTELKGLLAAKKVADVKWIEKMDVENKTILHWAVVFGSRRIAKKMTIEILKFPNGHIAKKRLADMRDQNGEMALHLAAKKGRAKIVMVLLDKELDVGPDWNIRADDTKEGKHKTALDHIYTHVPEAVIYQLDSSINYVKEVQVEGDDKNEMKFCDELVELDFGSIIGSREESDDEDRLKEANRLGGLMTDGAEKFKSILEHPLVQVFLYIKYQKAYVCILASIAFHIIWQLCYGYFLFDIYFNTCPWKLEKVGNISDIMECDGKELDFPGVPLAVVVWISGLIFLAKESFELCTVPWLRYFTQLENLGQIFSIVSVAVTCWPVYEHLGGSQNPVMVPWQYVLAAAAEFTAWALILGQVCKLLPLRIYIQIFVKVFKSFLMFICTFAALLLGFASAFCIMMPEAKAFKTPWLAVPKVLVMMTGQDDAAPSHYVTTQVLFSLFTIIMSLILLNLLIGLAVTDTQDLKIHCHTSELSSMLEEVYLLESFAVRIKRVLHFSWLINRLKISNLESNPDWLKNSDAKSRINCVTLEFSNAADYPFPDELMNVIRTLAEKNLKDQENAAGKGSNFTLSTDYNQDNIRKLIQTNSLLIQELKKQ